MSDTNTSYCITLWFLMLTLLVLLGYLNGVLKPWCAKQSSAELTE